MHHTARIAALLLLFLSCTVYRPRIPGSFDVGNTYVNTHVGFTVKLPGRQDGWNIGSKPSMVAPGLRKVFSSMQTPSSELLFIGLNDNSRCGIRGMVEANDASLEEYFKSMYLANEQVVSISADYYSDDNQEVIYWSYFGDVGQMRYRYGEYFIACGTMKLRLSYWTLASLYDDYSRMFKDILQTVHLAASSSGSAGGWNGASLYSAIEHPVSQYRIAFACNQKEINALDDGRDTICSGKDGALLWRVSGGDQPCYLFGSIHVLKPEMYPLRPQVEAAFDSSTSLVLELNSDTPENAKKIQLMAQTGLFRNDSTIRQVVSTGLYDSMLLYLEKWNIPPQRFTKLRPWMAALVLEQLQLQALGFSPEYGIEHHFLKELKGKEVLDLETVEEQADIFTSIDGQALLSRTLLEMNSTEKNLHQLVAAWSCGNAAALNALFLDDTSGAPPELLEKILYGRNRKMASKIAAMVRQGKRCFVVVGAAHLVGERSVVDYLRQEGFTIEQY